VTTKADSVSADILRKIVRGDLETGALLPKAEDLAEDYGVNRGVVREALKSLEVQHLVQPRRRRGTEILDPGTSLSADVIAAMLRPDGAEVATIDLDVLRDFLELRAVLDGEMARLAATHRTDEDIARLEAGLEGVRAAADDPKAYSRAIDALSLATAAATHNRMYPMLVHWHIRIQADLEDLLLTVRRPDPAHLQGLELLIHLVVQQDTEGIASLLRQFHAWAIPELLAAAAHRNGDCS